MGEIRNFQDLLYWSNNKLCDTTTKYHEWTDLSSIMVLETPKFDRVEEVNEEGQTVTKSTVCILVSSKQLLEYARNALFTNDLEPIDSALKMDATFKLVNNGWLLSPMCSETARFEPPCESYKGLKRTGHKHVVLPIAFLIHTTESSVPYQHSLKCLLNMPHTHFGFPNNTQFSFKWFVADNSRQAQNAVRSELGAETVILNCQDHLVRKYNEKKIRVNNMENLESIELCVRAMSRAATAKIQNYIFEVTALYAELWNETNWCNQFRRYYMHDINHRWYDTASGCVSLVP